MPSQPWPVVRGTRLRSLWDSVVFPRRPAARNIVSALRTSLPSFRHQSSTAPISSLLGKLDDAGTPAG
jgi:hypothetical protein